MNRTFLILTLVILSLGLLTCSREPVEKHAVIVTSMGTVVVDLFEEQAPLHAANFADSLVGTKALVGTYFHRIIPGFVVQGGDPNTLNDNRMDDGLGAVREERIPAEIGLPHLRGSVGAARTGDNVNPERMSSSSQFYICLDRLPQLDAGYTVFGQVVEGMAVVDAMAQQQTDPRDNPVKPIFIEDTYMETAKHFE